MRITPKVFRLSVTSSMAWLPFLAFNVYCYALSAQSKYPVAPNSSADNFACYIQTSDGRVLNLEHLCHQKPVKPAASPSQPACNSKDECLATQQQPPTLPTLPPDPALSSSPL